MIENESRAIHTGGDADLPAASGWRTTPWSLPEPSRPRLSLDGTWDFVPDFDGKLAIDEWLGERIPYEIRAIEVPFPWQAQFEDLREYSGVGWYRRRVRIPAEWANSSVVLHVGAADYFSVVWVDGRRLGEHEGGYLPFEFALPAGVSGEVEIVVKVVDPGESYERFPDWPFDEVPHGKQSWYGPVGGIWQSVWLEARPSRWVEQIFCTADLAGRAVDVAVALSTAPEEDAGQVELVLRDPSGRVVERRLLAFDPPAPAAIPPCAAAAAREGRLFTVRLPVEQPRAWSPADPALYSVEVTWSQPDGAADRVEEFFGMRSIEARDGRILLNGEPIYLFAALDQDYYPNTIYTPPSTEFLFDQFYKAREMGLNMLRCHIKVADPRYYEVADRMGVLVWAELPNWHLRTAAAARRATETLEGMVRRDWNHASIVIWTLVNEDWGTDLVNNGFDRDWLRAFYAGAKRLDPSRLVVDNSSCFPNFHVESDIEDFHNYYSIPDHRAKWDHWVKHLAGRGYWSYHHTASRARYCDDWDEPRDMYPGPGINRNSREPIVLSEFGNWGLPKLGPLYESHGGRPWWFDTGFDWGAVYPHDVEHRFKVYHLDKVFGSYDRLCELSQEQQYLALKYEIETIRRHSSITGYVITELTDVHWECNGLLDLCRNPKVFHGRLRDLNAETLLIPRPERYSFWGGDVLRVKVELAHAGGSTLEGCALRYNLPELERGGTLLVGPVKSGEVADLGWIELSLPLVGEPLKTRLLLSLLDASGEELARGYEDVYVFPADLRSAPEVEIGVWPGEPKLAEALAALGYRVRPMPADGQALVACTAVTPAVLEHVQRGGRALVFVEDATSLQHRVKGVDVLSREHTAWAGDWASNFNWLRHDLPAFSSIPGDGRFDLAFTNISPNYVLGGFAPRRYETDVLAGMFVGWVRDNVALAAVRRNGYGHFLFTTLNLLPNVPGDPLAVRLLHELVAHLARAR